MTREITWGLAGLTLFGIAASLAVVGFQDYEKNRRRAEALTNLSGIFTAMKASFAEY